MVCGGNNKLTVHHTFPKFIAKYVKLKLTNVFLCRPCHDRYEEWAKIFKEKLCIMHGINPHSSPTVSDPDKLFIRDMARVLIRNLHGKDGALFEQTFSFLAKQEKIKKEELTEELLLEMSERSVLINVKDYVAPGKLLLEAMGTEQLQMAWLEHFTDWFNHQSKTKRIKGRQCINLNYSELMETLSWQDVLLQDSILS